MKKMKTTIAVALAACVTTQVFAQVKEDVITFSLTGQKQLSVSTSASLNNVGTWSAQPLYYKTAATKVTDQDIIKFIGYVKHHNSTYYSTKAKLVLVQGELSGFFNITPDLGVSIPQNETTNVGSPYYLDGIIDDGSGNGYTQDFDAQTDIPNSTDSSYVTLANGHHFLVNGISGQYPVGHNQPWGQVFIKDIGKTGYSATDPLCENVTYYFAFSVEECYDCFYLNSFVSDTTFSVKVAQQTGPPCCGTTSTLVGKGKDRYYLTLSFDNTANNPYLNEHSAFWVGNSIGSSAEIGIGPDFPLVTGSPIPGDGVVPDQINNDFFSAPHNYQDTIRRNPSFTDLPYEARFTLNGILTYTWNLKFLNTSDISPDFLGVGSYAASGYGFVALYCTLFTGTATFTENSVKTVCCLDNGPWYDTYGGWYGTGAEYFETLDENNNVISEQTAYSYMYNFYGLNNPVTVTPLGTPLTPYFTPINTGASLTYHHNFDLNYGWSQANWGAGWPTPGAIQVTGEGSGLTYPQIQGWEDFDWNQGPNPTHP